MYGEDSQTICCIRWTIRMRDSTSMSALLVVQLGVLGVCPEVSFQAPI